MKVSQKGDMVPGTQNRKVQITGPVSSVHSAHIMILQRVCHDHAVAAASGVAPGVSVMNQQSPTALMGPGSGGQLVSASPYSAGQQYLQQSIPPIPQQQQSPQGSSGGSMLQVSQDYMYGSHYSA
eukprot:Filipodium_phascolosomae@DN2311_c0_g1_i7.p1